MIGFQINEKIERYGQEYFNDLLELGTCLISDSMKNFNTMHHSIKPINRKTRIVGNALTVKMRASDNLMLHKAVEIAEKGDIIIVDTCGSESSSILGELITTAALAKGVSGIVIDGGIRDIVELEEIEAPVFYRYITPSVGDKDGPGEIGTTVSCGNVSVNPGDIILGDGNGIVVIKPDEVEELIKIANNKLKFEDKRRNEIKNGLIKREGIDSILKEKGVIK